MNVKTDPLFQMLEKCCFEVTVNCNDTFYYASADAEGVDIQDLPKMLEVHEKWGMDGVDAFVALIRDEEVLIPLQTPAYKEAKESLKDYEFQTDEWRHRKWIRENPLESRLKQEQALKERVKYEKSQHGFIKCVWESIRNLFR